MMHYVQKIRQINKNGFSLLEILIALVIVSVLSVIAVNRYTSRSEEARISTAKADLKSISDAERQSEIDIGWYVTLRALDDIPGKGTTIFDNGIFQYHIGDEFTPFAIETDGSFYTGNVNVSNWKGPYINYQNIDSTGDFRGISNYGSPLDPWGHPYRLITPLITTNPKSNETNYTGLTDRMMVVSYGKDGVPGNGGAAGGSTFPGDPASDDIAYRF